MRWRHMRACILIQRVRDGCTADLLLCADQLRLRFSAGLCNRTRRSHSLTHSPTASAWSAMSSSSSAASGGGGGLSASPPAVLALDAFRMAGGVAGARQLGGGKDARVTAMACMGQSQEQKRRDTRRRREEEHGNAVHRSLPSDCRCRRRACSAFSARQPAHCSSAMRAAPSTCSLWHPTERQAQAMRVRRLSWW